MSFAPAKLRAPTPTHGSDGISQGCSTGVGCREPPVPAPQPCPCTVLVACLAALNHSRQAIWGSARLRNGRPRAALPGLLRDALLLLTLQTRCESRVPLPPALRGQVLRAARKMVLGANGAHASRDRRSPPTVSQALGTRGSPRSASPRRDAAAAAEPGQDAALSPGKPRTPSASIPRKAITAQQITGLIKSHYAISESKSDPGAAN